MNKNTKMPTPSTTPITGAVIMHPPCLDSIIIYPEYRIVKRRACQFCHPEHSEGSPSYRQITETAPAIIDETSFAEYLEQGPCLFIGDGAGKCADVIKHPNAHFCQCHPNAKAMLAPAMAALNEKQFEDVAYFEPFYLKEFVATVSKKKLF